jgi:hypothetical protein
MKKLLNQEEFKLELRKKRLSLEYERKSVCNLIDTLHSRIDEILYSIDEINLRINNIDNN